MRTKSFLKNGIIILIVQIFNYIIDFSNRTAVIYTLSMDYVGIKGLCNNILSILSLTELGIGSVLIYSMYKPVAENDTPKLLALIGYYKKAYYTIAGIISLLGLALTPFLPFLINDYSNIDGLYIIFLLYLANSAFSYLFTYKFSILDADQKMYIRTLWYSAFNLLRNIIQILILLLTGNFILYLVIQLLFTIIQNVFVSKRTEKEYPFLKTNQYPPLPKEETATMRKNIFAMFNHKIGGTVLNSTDNLIISRFIGIAAVAINDNYVLLVNTINNLIQQIFSALIASVGNLNATASKDELYKIFKILHFANFWFYTFCTNCLFLLMNPFIELLWGSNYLFSLPIVAIICSNFFIRGIRQIPLVFRDSIGLFWYDRYKPIIEASLNLIVSIIAVHYFGVAGVFAGTFFSMVSISLWVEPYVLFKHGFKMSWNEFWITNVAYFAIFVFITAATFFAGTLYQGSLIYAFIYRIAICIILPNLIMFLIFHRSEQFRQLLSSLNLKRLLKKEN